MNNITTALYMTSEMSMIIPLAFFCFIPVIDHKKNSFSRLILKITIAMASSFAVMLVVFSISPTIETANLVQIVLGGVMFVLYRREVDLPPFRLWFIFMTACLIGGHSYLIYHITDILLYPDGSIYNLYKPYSLLAQIIFECLVVLLFFIPAKKYLGWLVENYQEERIWRIVWIFPAAFTMFSYFFVPYNNSYMYLGRFMKMYLLFLVLSFIIVLVLYVLFYKIALTMTEKAELLTRSAYLEVQVQQYHELQSHVQETRRLRHDFRHHLAAISEMLEHGQYDEALNFLQEYRAEVSDMPKQYCSSTAVNAVLHHYESLLQSENIESQFYVQIPDSDRISDIDFCVLLGNLLENALHGCRTVKNHPRKVELQILQTTPHIIILQIKNPFEGPVSKSENAYVSTKHPGAGQGLNSVRMITAKYNGEVCIHSQDHNFVVQALLNI